MLFTSSVAVIGGGPAGVCAAIAAVQNGLGVDPSKGAVTLIEKKAYKSDRMISQEKVCAGFVPESGLRLMEKLGIPWRDFPHEKLTNMVFGNRGHVALDDPRKLTPFHPHRGLVETPDINLGAVFGRDTFDPGLVNYARQLGVNVLTNVSVSDVLPARDGFVILRKGRGGQHADIVGTARMVSGAYGANIMLGRKFAAIMGNHDRFPPAGKGMGRDMGMGYAYRAYTQDPLHSSQVFGNAMFCYGFNYPSVNQLSSGYLWSVPTPNGINFGVMGFDYGRATLFNTIDFKTMFPQYYHFEHGKQKHKCTKKRGAPLPMWEAGSVREIALGSNKTAIGIVGDAAGYVDPLTGEGIQQGMQSGANMGAAMAQAIVSGSMKPVEDLARDIPQSQGHKQRKASHFLAKHFIRKPELLHLLLDTLKQHPHFGRVINDYITHRQLKSYLKDPRIMSLAVALIKEAKIREVFWEMVTI
jgi:menaquinone-9 beta-reductase